MKIALGTAQFGLDYGVSNNSGQVSYSETKLILKKAKKFKICTLDTAMSYGNCEKILGDIGVSKFNLITKLPPIPKNLLDIEGWITENLNRSLDHLCVSKLYGLLLHNSGDLTGKFGEHYYQCLLNFKNLGIIEKIGISIYDTEELNLLQALNIKIDIVQSPFNIFDRRLKTSGWLDKLKKENIEIHIRSVFLQGLLLQNIDERNKYFDKWKSKFQLFHDWSNSTGQTQLEAALSFVTSHKSFSSIVLGVQNTAQLTEIYNYFDKKEFVNPPDELSSNDLGLINPLNWSL